MAPHHFGLIAASIPHLPPGEILPWQAYHLVEEQRGTLGVCTKSEETNYERRQKTVLV